jgi:hypothetical protein
LYFLAPATRNTPQYDRWPNGRDNPHGFLISTEGWLVKTISKMKKHCFSSWITLNFIPAWVQISIAAFAGA